MEEIKTYILGALAFIALILIAIVKHLKSKNQGLKLENLKEKEKELQDEVNDSKSNARKLADIARKLLGR